MQTLAEPCIVNRFHRVCCTANIVADAVFRTDAAIKLKRNYAPKSIVYRGGESEFELSIQRARICLKQHSTA